MTIEEQEKHTELFVERMRETLYKKGHDYSNEDRLSNFKLAGAITGGNAKINCLNLIGTKVARLGVLLNQEDKPKNESISDTLLDLANYAVLLDQIIWDEAITNVEFEEKK